MVRPGYKLFLSRHITTIALFLRHFIEKTTRNMYDTHSTCQGFFYGMVINNIYPDKLLILKLF